MGKKYICAKCKKEIVANRLPFPWRKMWYFQPSYSTQDNEFRNPFLCLDCFTDWTENYYDKHLGKKCKHEQWKEGFEKWLGRKWTPFPPCRAWRIA